MDKEKLFNVAFALSGKSGWASVTLKDIAISYGCSYAEILEWYPTKNDFLYGFSRYIDGLLAQEVETSYSGATLKDALFDILMARFDLFGDYKPALSNAFKETFSDPVNALCVLPHLPQSMTSVIELTGADDFKRPLLKAKWISILCYAYLRTLRVWCEDESVDLSKTMAALDKNLRYFDTVLI